MKITSDLLAKLVPGTSAAKRDRFLPFLNDACPRFEINTELRLAAFLATCIVESDHFKATEEYGKGKGRYYGKPDAVTGKVYYGRGITQTTHKANYKAFTDFIKDSDHEEKPNFVLHPELLAEPYWAVESACYFWQSNNLNKYADRGQFFETQGLVNRGSARKEALGYDERLALYRKALKLLPDNFSFTTDSAADTKPQQVSDTLPAVNAPEQPAVTTNETPPIQTTTIETTTTPPQPPSGAITETVTTTESQQTTIVTAPEKENSTATATKLTIGGFAVPTVLVTIFGTIKSTIDAGFLSASQVGEMVLNFIQSNAKFFFAGVGLIIIGLMLKKAFKQVAFYLQMYFAARKDMNNVEIKKS